MTTELRMRPVRRVRRIHWVRRTHDVLARQAAPVATPVARGDYRAQPIQAGYRAQPVQHGRATPQARSGTRPVPVLVCGSRAFAIRMIPALGKVPGVSVIGHSSGDDMALELARFRWPDIAIIDAGAGHRLAHSQTVPELNGKMASCAVVMIVPEPLADDPQPIEVWRHWSVLLEESATSPTLLGIALHSAARGVASIDRSIDESMIEYMAPEPIAPLSLVDGLHRL